MKNPKKEKYLKQLGTIINLTMHSASPEQGCFEPEKKEDVKDLLLFRKIPTAQEIKQRALLLAYIAHESGANYAMIGGALYLMRSLERSLLDLGITPVYSFSERVSFENTDKNGEVQKRVTFKHSGFVEAVHV